MPCTVLVDLELMPATPPRGVLFLRWHLRSSGSCVPCYCHAAATYGKYLAVNGHDDKILEILNDELEHSRELQEAMEMNL